ncbi:LL-diaminopimelate aminotransferase [Hydrogenivirga caldilitoris]|uniref:LL-diaminopimelate aminotransferase n=1 Tax=Hydrogenivirga caldilitoris TaxID=246264 RepID=A0A497XLM6_9AQUI|nr:LL-diaminopimelate aminotransferase [Hydrogenivirga caldilitoris]RLJ69776.1 LL-diaminopimelate aminotransferase [Hydrogenivirga caldilitoris]
MAFELAQRLKVLPPYLFAELDRRKQEKLAQGVDVIDLGVGDPDLPTPEPIVEALCRAAKKPENHRYPSYVGMKAYREAVAQWYKRRFDINLDPNREVTALIGSKEGIAHFPLAFVQEGDVVLCPDPAYPVYKIGTIFAGGKPYTMPLKEENDFLPDIGSIPQEIVDKAKIIWVNYPNNPTSADATEDFYRDLVRWAKKHNIIVASDNAYSEIYMGDRRPISILQIEGAKEVAIEFHSLSKTYNMTGWRIGMAVGNEELVKALGKVKTNVDSGQFNAVQEAGITALSLPEDELDKLRAVYRERREVMTAALKSLGLEPLESDVTFYVWTKVPKGYTSAEFVGRLIDEAGIVCTPGNGFGEAGEGFFRISLTVPTERLVEAAKRIENLKL